jgi:hypothetical protein
VNDFAYALGNPIWLWDPGGLAPSRAEQAEALRQEAAEMRRDASVLEKVATGFALLAAITPRPASAVLQILSAKANLAASELRDQAAEKDRRADELLRPERREGRRGGGASSGPPSSSGDLPFGHSLFEVPTHPWTDPTGPCSPVGMMTSAAARRWIALAVGLQVVAALLLGRGGRLGKRSGR